VFRFDLPPLDCHAHIAPDVTASQVAGLKGALIWAMTRTPAEARFAARRRDETILWGFGVHPGVPAALAAIDGLRLAEQLDQFVIVGEIGLDRRGPVAEQRRVLEAVMTACAARPVLLSLHSAGRTGELLAVLRQQPHPGAVLHWFNGTEEQFAEAVDLGCYFSVNNAMSDERLDAIPSERVLPETDFPSSRRTILASRPGDMTTLERRFAQRDRIDEAAVRRRWYANFGHLADAAGVRARLPDLWRQVLQAAEK
jgi:TatD DNase family protein